MLLKIFSVEGNLFIFGLVSYFYLYINVYTVELVTTLGTPKIWPLLTGGRCSEEGLCYKTQFGTLKWWSLKAGGRYSEVVVSSGLIV